MPPVATHITFPRSIPQAVPILNAITPSTITLRNESVMIVFAVVVAPTVVPRNIVIIFISSFCAVFAILSQAPLSLSRLPNISIPTSGAAEGIIRAMTTVTRIGKIIFSTFDTGLS